MPTPALTPTLVTPVPNPHRTLPVGSVTVTPTPTFGDQPVGKVYAAAAETGRSVSPLRETERPPAAGDCDIRTPEGITESVSHDVGSYSNVVVRACSLRTSLSDTTPTATPART